MTMTRLYIILVLIWLVVTGALMVSFGLGQTTPQAKVSWRANTEPNIAGYRVYQALASHSYAAGPVYLLQPSSTSVTLFLPAQRCTVTYFWTVTAFNTHGQESVKSVEVRKSITGTQYWIGACKK